MTLSNLSLQSKGYIFTFCENLKELQPYCDCITKKLGLHKDCHSFDIKMINISS